MPQNIRVTITLPPTLLAAVDEECRRAGETRREFIRGALETYLRQRRERDDIARYVQGYIEQPESEEETAAMEALAMCALSSEPWDTSAPAGGENVQ
jgi:metal-responsive CopG/Arc/MetJ family transcriptional regulator